MAYSIDQSLRLGYFSEDTLRPRSSFAKGQIEYHLNRLWVKPIMF